jgi:DNA-binding winged helix-turn-helix (wHTH) protein
MRSWMNTTALDILDTATGLIYLYDQPVKVSPLEWRILRELARCHGEQVSHRDMAPIVDPELNLYDDDGKRIPSYSLDVERVRRAVNRAQHKLPFGWVETLPRAMGWKLNVPEPVAIYAFS